MLESFLYKHYRSDGAGFSTCSVTSCCCWHTRKSLFSSDEYSLYFSAQTKVFGKLRVYYPEHEIVKVVLGKKHSTDR